MNDDHYVSPTNLVSMTKAIVKTVRDGKKVIIIVKDGPSIAKMKTGLIVCGIDSKELHDVTIVNARCDFQRVVGRNYDDLFIEPAAYDRYPFSVSRLVGYVEQRMTKPEEP